MKLRKGFALFKWLVLLSSLFLFAACGSSGGGGGGNDGDDDSNIPATKNDYTLLAWNDLGMHCLNPTYDTLVILPPYNTVWAQLLKRGNPPELVTTDVTLTYAMVNNTSSVDKTSSLFGGDYGQFWDYAKDLFGLNTRPDDNVGLTGNGLVGTMVPVGTHFEIVGIPVTPVDDDGVWNPYQVVEITATDSSGTVIAQTRATVPTSDEINCGKCHDGNNVAETFTDILEEHDDEHGTDLVNSTPVLCADCHGSPVLGTSGPGSSGLYLSEAIHGLHADEGASCYDCHPGDTTQCNRSLAHTATDGNCKACHGDMDNVADTISDDGRIPWESEPKCSDCHGGIAEVDTGEVLYRNAVGHGGVNCAGCHGSPHAMYPSGEDTDNYQPEQYQGEALTLGSCAVCHSKARGDGLGEFLDEHGGSKNPSACAVCHTEIDTINPNLWPHHYEWTNH